MAKSMYNQVLLEKAVSLQSFVKGESIEVDLGGFQVLSEKRAIEKGKTSRKTWEDSAEVVSSEKGPIVTGTINAHMIAVGDVIGAMGFTGTFSVTQKLQLIKGKLEKKTPTYVTIADILAALK